MLATERLNHWLSRVGADAGQAPCLDEKGVCAFVFEDEVEVLISADDQSPFLYFFAELLSLGDRDESAKAKIFEHCLKVNLCPSLTAGAAIAFDPVHHRVVFNETIALEDLDEHRFFSRFSAIGTKTVALWRTFNGRSDQAVQDGVDASTPDRMPEMGPVLPFEGFV